MKKILLLSNRLLESSNFIWYLKTLYEVEDMASMHTALYKLKKPERYGLIIIEPAMPPQDLYTLKETTDGLKTGLVFYEQNLKALGIPTIFWSWIDSYTEDVSKIGRDDVVFLKKEIDNKHLLEAVKKFLIGRNLGLKILTKDETEKILKS